MTRMPVCRSPWGVCVLGVFLFGCATSTPSPAATPDAGLSCIACSVWQVRCGDHCVDLTVSPDNCGGCGVHCDTRSQICTAGVCTPVINRCTPLGPSDAGTLSDASFDVLPGTDVLPGDTTEIPDAGFATTAGLRGEYYGTTSLTQLLLVRTDPVVDFNWGMVAPDPSVPRENFSVRWLGQVSPPVSGTYTLATVSDDGVRLWINGQLLIDDWTMHGTTEDDATISLSAGRLYDLRLEYFQGTGGAEIHLYWSADSIPREIVPSTDLSPGTGINDTCTGGVCCPAGGSVPICCPLGTTCVVNSGFSGCCPAGERCGITPTCTGDF